MHRLQESPISWWVVFVAFLLNLITVASAENDRRKAGLLIICITWMVVLIQVQQNCVHLRLLLATFAVKLAIWFLSDEGPSFFATIDVLFDVSFVVRFLSWMVIEWMHAEKPDQPDNADTHVSLIQRLKAAMLWKYEWYFWNVYEPRRLELELWWKRYSCPAVRQTTPPKRASRPTPTKPYVPPERRRVFRPSYRPTYASGPLSGTPQPTPRPQPSPHTNRGMPPLGQIYNPRSNLFSDRRRHDRFGDGRPRQVARSSLPTALPPFRPTAAKKHAAGLQPHLTTTLVGPQPEPQPAPSIDPRIVQLHLLHQEFVRRVPYLQKNVDDFVYHAVGSPEYMSSMEALGSQMVWAYASLSEFFKGGLTYDQSSVFQWPDIMLVLYNQIQPHGYELQQLGNEPLNKFVECLQDFCLFLGVPNMQLLDMTPPFLPPPPPQQVVPVTPANQPEGHQAPIPPTPTFLPPQPPSGLGSQNPPAPPASPSIFGDPLNQPAPGAKSAAFLDAQRRNRLDGSRGASNARRAGPAAAPAASPAPPTSYVTLPPVHTTPQIEAQDWTVDPRDISVKKPENWGLNVDQLFALSFSSELQLSKMPRASSLPKRLEMLGKQFQAPLTKATYMLKSQVQTDKQRMKHRKANGVTGLSGEITEFLGQVNKMLIAATALDGGQKGYKWSTVTNEDQRDFRMALRSFNDVYEDYESLIEIPEMRKQLVALRKWFPGPNGDVEGYYKV